MIWVIVILSVLAVLLATMLFVTFKKLKREQEPKREDLDLIDFFSRGGVAYYWQKGGKQQKCYTYEEFLKIKADYVELWLNQNRYIFKTQADKL